MRGKKATNGIKKEDVFKSEKYGDFEVVEYINSRNVVVRFLSTGFETTAQAVSVLKGNIKDKYLPSVHGVGILGDNLTVDETGKHTKEYKLWSDAIGRCYSIKTHKKSKSYSDCYLTDDFLRFSYFSSWCKEQKGFGNEGWVIDKDLLVKGNRVYGEGFCCFLPEEINIALTNSKSARGSYPIGVSFNKPRRKFVAATSRIEGTSKHLGIFETPLEAFLCYKDYKEQYLKHLAERYKDQLDPRAYNALLLWEVNIDD